MTWRDDAQCQGMDFTIFFPNDGIGSGKVARNIQIAKSICKECTVRRECLDYALSNNIKDGIFGGLTWKQRRSVAHET